MREDDFPDLRSHIADIARGALGEPNKELSTRDQLRFGSHGSLAVEIAGAKRGEWFDHEEGTGGGPWELLRIKLGLDSHQIHDWLKAKLGIERDAPKRNGKSRRGGGAIVKAYDYRDETGTLLFQVCRLDPKTFRQRRLDRKGGWTWSVKGVRLVPFRLPELLASSDTLVFIPEGEKDCDRLAELGLIATCNPGGAGKWRSSFSAFFRGRDVVVLPDNDDAGRKHARAVAANLVSVAARVGILDLPGLPSKGDVSDWLDAGETREELERLAREVPLFKPETATEKLDDDAEIARLAKLSPLAYDREREPAAERLDVRVLSLDRAVRAERGNGGAPGQGRPLELPEPEPWPEPVSGAALLDDLASIVRQFVVMPLEAGRAIALWTVFTHAFAAAVFAPKLLVKSAQKRSGKTRLLEVLAYLTPRAQSASHLTAATAFRVIEEHRPTLLIDEADTFVRDNEELRGIINSGFSRENAKVLRSVPVGDGWDVREFSTWCPQAIAGIGRMPDTILDRSFVIEMKRKLPEEKVARLRRRDAAPLIELARKAARWAADHVHELEAATPEMPAGLNDRACDAWELCIAIADLAGNGWGKFARDAAKALSGDTSAEDDSPAVQLLADLRDLFDAEPSGVLFTEEMLKALAKRDDRAWPEWGKAGRPISGRQVAALLKPLGIKTNKTVRRGANTDKGYRREWFDDAFARYLPNLAPSQSVTRSQVADSTAFSDSRSVTRFSAVTDTISENPSVSAVVTDVSDRSPPRGDYYNEAPWRTTL
jgi:putative DNA primase/helicase